MALREAFFCSIFLFSINAAAAKPSVPTADPMPPFPSGRPASFLKTTPEQAVRMAASAAAFLAAAEKYDKAMKALPQTALRKKAIADNAKRFEDEKAFLAKALEDLAQWTSRQSIDIATRQPTTADLPGIKAPDTHQPFHDPHE